MTADERRAVLVLLLGLAQIVLIFRGRREDWLA
jgi:hypothetical protein